MHLTSCFGLWPPGDLQTAPQSCCLNHHCESHLHTLKTFMKSHTTDSWRSRSGPVYRSTREPADIPRFLEEHKIAQWGFVIFRCTYSSQGK